MCSGIESCRVAHGLWSGVPQRLERAGECRLGQVMAKKWSYEWEGSGQARQRPSYRGTRGCLELYHFPLAIDNCHYGYQWRVTKRSQFGFWQVWELLFPLHCLAGVFSLSAFSPGPVTFSFAVFPVSGDYLETRRLLIFPTLFTGHLPGEHAKTVWEACQIWLERCLPYTYKI